jgi:parallel beta-helix repeat protein
VTALPAIQSPYALVLNLAGAGLNAGKVYIGVAGQDPQTFPQAVYWDSAGTIPATQPLDVLGGYIMRLGSPAQIFTAPTYSMRVRDKLGVQVFYQPSMPTVTDVSSSVISFPAIGTVTRTVAAKLFDFINAADFGAVGDGITDDTIALQAAITAAYGAVLYLPGKTYLVSALTIASGISISGAGYARTTIKLKASANTIPLTISAANNVVLSDLTVDGNKAANASGFSCVRTTGACDAPEFHRVRFLNAKTDGLSQAGTVSKMVVSGCVAEYCGNDGFSISSATTSLITGNRSNNNGRFGIVVTSDYNRVVGNTCYSNTSTGIALVGGDYCVATGNSCFGNTGHGLQFNACTNSIQSGNNCSSNGLSGLDQTLGCTNCTTIGNLSWGNTVRGIEIDSGTYQAIVTGNTVLNNGEVGISVYRSPGTIVTNNQCLNNGNTTAPRYGIRLWDDVGTLASSGCLIANNFLGDNRGGSATQTHGLGIDDANVVNTILTGNNFVGNVTLPILTAAPALNIKRARDNIGWITQSEGSSAIASGTTAITVNHGLSVTPVARDFQLMATSGSTADPGQIWISGITATQFTVNCRTNPGVGGLNFLWKASAY